MGGGLSSILGKIKKLFFFEKSIDKFCGLWYNRKTARQHPAPGSPRQKAPGGGRRGFSGGGLPTLQPTSQRRVEATKLVEEWGGERKLGRTSLSLYTYILHHLGYFVKRFLGRFFQIFLGFCEVGFALFFSSDNKIIHFQLTDKSRYFLI